MLYERSWSQRLGTEDRKHLQESGKGDLTEKERKRKGNFLQSGKISWQGKIRCEQGK
jgi:hypothetical protein